jgi:hypothetical protein
MENLHWNPGHPLPVRGPIWLQTHGGEIRWRNIFIREIPADEANAWLASHDTDGFAPVFNGVDFLGWGGPIDGWEVFEGSLVCKRGAGGTIFTESVWKDFTARLELRLPPGGNNGLAIRYPGDGDTAYVGMCELQVLDNTAMKYAGLDPRQYHGSAYGMAAAERGFLREPGEWNFQQVTVAGSRITVELNGTVILDTDLATIEEFLGDTPHPGKDRSEGHFGLAGHGDAVEFRNIQLRPIAR